MSFTFACIAISCAALLFFSTVSFSSNSKTEWLNGKAMYWVRSILLFTTLGAAPLAVVFRFLK